LALTALRSLLREEEQAGLGVFIAERDGALQPLVAQLVVDLDRIGPLVAAAVETTERVLRGGNVLVGGLVEPTQRFGVVAYHPLALEVGSTQVVLRHAIAGSRRFAIELRSARRIALHALPRGIQEPEIDLRIVVAA